MNLFVKRCLMIFPIVCVALGLTITVVAHSGRTDGAGGHYDRSTGKYHYHHGYSAHQHYDMDGDGIADCPHKFKDKTDHSANNGNTSSESSIDNIKGSSTGINFWDVLMAMLTELLPAIAISFGGSYLLSHIWLLIFKEEKGCLITWISMAVLFIVSYIWLIYIKVT